MKKTILSAVIFSCAMYATAQTGGAPQISDIYGQYVLEYSYYQINSSRQPTGTVTNMVDTVEIKADPSDNNYIVCNSINARKRIFSFRSSKSNLPPIDANTASSSGYALLSKGVTYTGILVNDAGMKSEGSNALKMVWSSGRASIGRITSPAHIGIEPHTMGNRYEVSVTRGSRSK